MNATLEPTIDETLPTRRRPSAFGRGAMALSAVVILALGFIGGVEVQKQQRSPSVSAATGAPAAFGGGRRGGLGGPPRGGRDGRSYVVTGTVANANGRDIYVKD